MTPDDLPRRRVLALTGSALTAGLAGCSGGSGGSTPAGGDGGSTAEPTTDDGMATTEGGVQPALEVADAESDDGTIEVPRAAVDAEGWLVVHPAADGGGPNGGVVLANRRLEPGEHTDVELELSAYVAGEQTVFPMLHYDDPADDEFTFPAEGDPPVTADGSPLVKPMTYRYTGSFTPALEVADQTADGSTVTVPRATIDDAGWLIVHPEAEGGGPNGGEVLASRQLEAGTYADVELSLSESLSSDATVYAMLHYDDPGDGGFTFPAEGDPPVSADGAPVVEPFAVTVDGGDTIDGGTDGGGTTTVEMEDTAYAPIRASVEPGTTVEWVNRDGYGHDVASAAFHDAAESWDFQSETVGQGGTVSYTFEEAGVYEYYCTIHGESSMCGAVLVGDVSLEASLPCEE